jgi:hypothetical protein
MQFGREIRVHTARAIAVSLVVAFLTGAGSAQQPDPAVAPGAGLPEKERAKDPAIRADPQPTPQQTRVVDAYREGKHSLAFDDDGKKFLAPEQTRDECNKQARADTEDCADRRTARLNEIVYVRVASLAPLLNQAKCIEVKATGSTERRANCQDQEILLFLNGRPIKGLFPESGAPELEANGAGTLRYHLRRYEGTSAAADAESDEHWADLLGLDPAGAQWGLTRQNVNVSVGLENGFPVPTDVTNFRLRRMRGWFLIGFVVLAAAILYWLVRLAQESDILRDRRPVLREQRKPYSLAATQAAWWFVLTVMSFVFIWLVTGEYDLSTSVLVLLGIGFGTALGAQIIDRSKGSTPIPDVGGPSPDLSALINQKVDLERKLASLERRLKAASPPDQPALQVELDAAKASYAETITEIRQKFPDAIGPGATSFHIDLLSDAQGINFHRFQMVVWTVVLGLIFVYAVLSRLAMPKFSETLLALMGLSAGTYLGFKIPENNTTSPSGPTAPTQSGAGQPKPPNPKPPAVPPAVP